MYHNHCYHIQYQITSMYKGSNKSYIVTFWYVSEDLRKQRNIHLDSVDACTW